jgi:hypothetical protein
VSLNKLITTWWKNQISYQFFPYHANMRILRSVYLLIWAKINLLISRRGVEILLRAADTLPTCDLLLGSLFNKLKINTPLCFILGRSEFG